MDQELIQRLVDTHIGMYLDGLGGSCATSVTLSNAGGKVDSGIE